LREHATSSYDIRIKLSSIKKADPLGQIDSQLIDAWRRLLGMRAFKRRVSDGGDLGTMCFFHAGTLRRQAVSYVDKPEFELSMIANAATVGKNDR
jgi:hypothetical protein